MPGLDYMMQEQMKNLAERLQERQQEIADVCHAQGRKSPMEEIAESLQRNFDESLKSEFTDEDIENYKKLLQS